MNALYGKFIVCFIAATTTHKKEKETTETKTQLLFCALSKGLPTDPT